jgi:hypothetical protein
MRGRRERLLDAYRDDPEILSAPERARVRGWLEADPDARGRLGIVEALGRSVHAAWTETPQAPPVEYFLAAIRPELRRIDAERAGRRTSRLGRWREPLRRRAVPLAAIAACAAVAALALWPGLRPATPAEGKRVTAVPSAPSTISFPGATASVDSPSAVYDLAQEDEPLMVFEGPDGSTVIWMLEGDDNVSRHPFPADGWA